HSPPIIAPPSFVRPSLERGFTVVLHDTIARRGGSGLLCGGAGDRALASGRGSLRIGGERGLRAPIGSDEARLPAGKGGVVAQLEVEEGADAGLAVGEADGGGELRRLLRLGDGAAVGLGAGVERARRRRLEAVLEVPDRDAPLAGQRLPRAGEAVAERGEQAVEVALVDRAVRVPGRRGLRRGLRIGVV